MSRGRALKQSAGPCKSTPAQSIALGSRCVRSRFDPRDQIAHSPRGIFNASGHRWRASHCAIELHEVVIGVMQGDRSAEVLKLFRESIGEATQATAVHSQRVI